MDWREIKSVEAEAIQIPENWLHTHYYEALTILFRIENALRMFVYLTLKTKFQDKWDEQSVTSDDAGEGTIASVAKKRAHQARVFGYLGYPGTCPIMYLTAGELIRLITSDGYWKHFKKAFVASKEIVKNKLDEIGAVRNALAHFRPIKKDDVEVIKQNAKQILSNIEVQLGEITSLLKRVPTNTGDQWYRDLRSLGTDLCGIDFYQSTAGEWIEIVTRYNCPIISHDSIRKSHFFKLLTINGPHILERHTSLAKLVIYMSERVDGTIVDRNGQAEFGKRVATVLNIDTLRENYHEIKTELEGLLVTVSEETELIRQDNLAEGKLIDMATARATIKDGEESGWADVSGLKSPVHESSPPEWWGEIPFVTRHFLSDTPIYPWMETDVARAVFPF